MTLRPATRVAAGGERVPGSATCAQFRAGVALHARFGFAGTARLPQVGYKAGRWGDLVLMQKMLSAAPDSGSAAG